MGTPLNDMLDRALKGYRPWRELLDRMRTGPFPFTVAGPRGAYLAYLAHQMSQRASLPLLIIVPTEQEAESVIRDLEFFGASPLVMPWWGSMPYRPLPRTAPVFGERARALGQLLTEPPKIVVASLRAFLTPVPDPVRFGARLTRVRVGDSFDPVDLGRRLEEYGYSRVPKVGVRGEYAIRGEVVDLFQPGDDHAIRIVFEWDEIEEIRRFEADTQSSVGRIDEFILHPEREVVWDEVELANAESHLRSLGEIRDADTLVEQLNEQRWAEGEEAYFPLADAQPHYLPEYLPEGVTALFTDNERLVASYDALEREYQGLYSSERVRRDVPRPSRLLQSFEQARESLDRHVLFPVLSDSEHDDALRLPCDPPRSFFGNVSFFREELENLQRAGFSVAIYADSDAQSG
ncbi:MAG: hypothetical protein ACOC2Q_04395, partial [Spirochaetota bacterium]